MNMFETQIESQSLQAHSISRKDSTRMVHTKKAGWMTSMQHGQPFTESSAPNWFQLEQESNAICLKRGHARKTWQLTWRDQTYIVKVFERGNFLDRVKHFFVHNQAWSEWKHSQRAIQRGLPVASCLAIGWESRGSYRTVLIFSYIEKSQTLARIWESATDTLSETVRFQSTTRLIQTIARLFAQAHERGFVHCDGHPNNILLQDTTSGNHNAIWIDLHESKLGNKSIAYTDRVRSLAQLDHYFKRHATRTERLRFLQYYAKDCNNFARLLEHQPSGRILLSEMKHAELTHTIQLALHRDRRMRHNSKYFSLINPQQNGSGKVALTLERRHAYPEVDVLDRTLADWEDILKSYYESNKDFDHPIKSINLNDLQLDFLKAENLFTILMWNINGSPCRRYFYRCHHLRHRDISAPLVLGYIEHRSGGLIDHAILIRPQCDHP